MKNKVEISHLLERIISIIYLNDIADKYYIYSTNGNGQRQKTFDGLIPLLKVNGFCWNKRNIFYFTLDELEIIKSINFNELEELRDFVTECWNKIYKYEEVIDILLDLKGKREQDAVINAKIEGVNQSDLFLILHDDKEYKYKSDKIKGFLKLGLSIEATAKILNQRKEMKVTSSYVLQIAKNLYPNVYTT